MASYAITLKTLNPIFLLSLCKLQLQLYVPAACLIFAESHVFAPLAVSSPRQTHTLQDSAVSQHHSVCS